jgi:hypothetical protein
MGYRNKKKYEPYVKILWEMMDSEVWKKLSNSSKVTYIYLRRQIRSAKQKDVKLSYTNMEPIMNRNTFGRALKELEKCGFITKIQTGGLFRRINIFQLSEEWRKIGKI